MIKFFRSKLMAILGIFLSIAILFSGCSISIPPIVEDYIDKNIKTIDFNEDLDYETIGGTGRVILVGEDHTKSKSKEMNKKMVKYFYEKERVRYLFCEVGFTSGIFLDRCIANGDEEGLKYYMEQLKGTLSYTQEEYEFWKWLMEYNKTIPIDKRIRIIGLDVDHQTKLATKGLIMLLELNPSHLIKNTAIKVGIENIKNLPADEAIYEFFNLMRLYRSEMETEYDGMFELVDQVYENLKITDEYYIERKKNNPRNYDLRDKAMMSNFKVALEKFRSSVYLGILGAEHIFQSSCETESHSKKYNRFGMRLNEKESPVEGQVCSILYTFADEKMSSDNCSPMAKYINFPLVKIWSGKDVFLSLDDDETPFLSGQYLMKKAINGKNTTDYVQKLVLLSNSTDCSPYSQ